MSWIAIEETPRDELVEEVAPLPTSVRLGTEEAKRFDLLLFSLELAVLKGSKRFETLRKQFLEIASALEEQTAIPGIAARAELIEPRSAAGRRGRLRVSSSDQWRGFSSAMWRR